MTKETSRRKFIRSLKHNWIPLAAGVPTKEMAQRMAEVLSTESWQTPLPIPTLDRNHDAGRPDKKIQIAP